MFFNTTTNLLYVSDNAGVWVPVGSGLSPSPNSTLTFDVNKAGTPFGSIKVCLAVISSLASGTYIINVGPGVYNAATGEDSLTTILPGVFITGSYATTLNFDIQLLATGQLAGLSNLIMQGNVNLLYANSAFVIENVKM